MAGCFFYNFSAIQVLMRECIPVVPADLSRSPCAGSTCVEVQQYLTIDIAIITLIKCS